MKHFFLMIAIALTAFMFNANSGHAQTENAEVFSVVEIAPQFLGGEVAMSQFLAKNLKYPTEALKKNIQGTVYVEFIIEKDGSVNKVAVKRDIGSGCGEEAVRVIKMMPKWTPGKQRGNTVRTQLILPVAFKLS